jgi:hypothetical protein
MPNQNPSGANQPLNQHPLPANRRYQLGMDARIIDAVVAATSYEVVPTPPEGVVRDLGLGLQEFTVGEGALDATDCEFYFVDSQGREVQLVTSAAEAADSVFPGIAGTLLGGAPLFLMPEDGGIFFRFAAGGTGGGNNVLQSAWADTRNVYRQVTQLSTSPQAILPATPEGNVLFTPNFDQVPSTADLIGVNFDGAPVDILFELYDGINTVRLGPPVTVPLAPTPGALGAALAGVPATSIVQPPGWEVRATIVSAAPAEAVEVYAYYCFANQGPVRQDQGGAY